jgi:hypothetical protein
MAWYVVAKLILHLIAYILVVVALYDAAKHKDMCFTVVYSTMLLALALLVKRC